MMLSRRALLVLSLTLAPLATTSFVQAETASVAGGEATRFLKAKQDAVYKLLTSQSASPERDKKVDAELATLIDYDEMAKQALGKDEADKRKPEEFKRFRELLQQLIEKNYKKKLDETLNYDISYTSENKEGSDVVVATEAKNRKDQRAAPVSLKYKLRPSAKGSYAMVDLIAEESSMVSTYRKEFTKIIKKDGWDALIRKMEDKLAKS